MSKSSIPMKEVNCGSSLFSVGRFKIGLRDFCATILRSPDLTDLAFKIAVENKTTFCDSLFLAAAEKEQVPLLTLDKKLYDKVKANKDVRLYSQNIDNFCFDMSPAFISGMEDKFPNASITFDKFHVMKLMNEAIDEVRRAEQSHNVL